MKPYVAGMVGALMLAGTVAWAQETPEAGREAPSEGRERAAGKSEGRRMREPGGEQRSDMLLNRLVNNAKMAQEIGLTEQQISDLKTGSDELRKKEIDLMAEIEKNGVDQAKLMTDKVINEEAVMAAIDQVSKSRTELAKIQVKRVLLLNKILTPEQREKLKEMMQEHMGERKERLERSRKNAGEAGKDGQQPAQNKE